MKKFNCGETLDAIIYPPPQERKNRRNNCEYSTEFQAMLDNLEAEDYIEEMNQANSDKKKRRLTNQQVRALERIFEINNKLDPHLKMTIAEDLRLQPRQVAIWFQNRRARWKTKQMEREYSVLKAEYEALEINFDRLEREREALTEQLQELRSKLEVENSDSNHSINGNTSPIRKNNNNVTEQGTFSLLRNPNHELHHRATNSKEFQGYVGSKDGFLFNGNFNGNHEGSGSGSSPSWVKIEEDGLLSTTEGPTYFFPLDQPPSIRWKY